MSQKRKIEEYHDPDYPQASNPAKQQCRQTTTTTATPRTNPEEQIEKIQAIIVREFKKEMTTKEQEIIEIDNRIRLARKLLHKVRYAVVSNYYNKSDAVVYTADGKLPDSLFENDQKPPQSAIHPSVKKILGTQLSDYEELLQTRQPRQAATSAKSSIKEKLKTKKEKRLERAKLQQNTNHIIGLESAPSAAAFEIFPEKTRTTNEIPSSISKRREEIITKLNTARSGHKKKHLIVVGNTSKYIGDEDTAASNISHKWLVYIQTKTEDSIEEIVSKVRFFLHPSYKPNDVIDINSSPFQLSRRGWGEFPIRLQLFFHSKFKQKPVQLVHNLVLDKTMSGLQTMGAETLVEIWLRSNCMKTAAAATTETRPLGIKNEPSTDEFAKHEELNRQKSQILSPIIEKNLLDFLDKIETTSISSDIDNIEPSLLLSPNNLLNISDVFTPKHKITAEHCTEVHPNPNIFNNYIDIADHIAEVCKNEQHNIPFNIQATNMKLHELGVTNVNIKSAEEMDVNILESPIKFTNNIIPPIQPLTSNVKNKLSYAAGNRDQVFLKNGKMYILDSSQSKIKLESNNKQKSLLKPQVSLLKPFVTCRKPNKYTITNPLLYDHDYTPKRQNLSFENVPKVTLKCNQAAPTHNRTIEQTPKNHIVKNIVLMQKPRVNYRENFENEFFDRIFISESHLIEYLLKTIPLINNLAIQSDYKISFPFVVQSLEVYENSIEPKRKSNEWLQCKYFSKLMAKHKNFKGSSNWSTKEIILFARSHGYTPSCSTNFMRSQSLSTPNECSISTNADFNEILEWLGIKNNEIINDEEIINIDDDSDSENIQKPPLKLIKDYSDTLWMDIDKKYDNDANLIENICYEIGIRLEPEKITKDVMHESAKLVLIKTMRCFIEELIRKSLSKKFEKDNRGFGWSAIEFQHVKAAILTNSRFNFLNNSDFWLCNEIRSAEMRPDDDKF